MNTLDNKVAVVTGGSSGIGLATAQRFIAEGARVVVTGRNQEALDAAVSTLGGRATGIRGDVANLDDLDRLFAQVRERFGRVDVLFANAGVAPFVPFRAVTEEHFDRLFNINVRGLFFTVHKALPLLSDGASVILNASVRGSGRAAEHERLCRNESRGSLAGPHAGSGTRAARHSRQCRQSRPHRDAARGQTRSEPRGSGGVRRAGRPADPARSLRQGRGDCRNGRVSGV